MEICGQGSSGVKVVTRRHLYEIMRNCPEPTLSKKLEFMENYLIKDKNFNKEDKENVSLQIRILKSKFKTKWQGAHKKHDVFLKKNSDWLDGTISIPSEKRTSGTGRPTLSFEESSERSKRRKTKELRSSSVDELTYAAQMKLRESGNVAASRIVKDVTVSPTRGKKYQKAFSSISTSVRQMSPQEALAIFVEADSSRRQYEIYRSADKKLYPCYSVLQRAKRECYPSKDAISISATSAEVKLQNLLDHTSSRLCEYLKDSLFILSEDEMNNLEIIYKWGCDGSNQSRYKQKFEDPASSDANIFQSSMVPLKLLARNKSIWENPRPSSARFCRPIRIRFLQESVDVTNEEVNYINHQIKTLTRSDIKIEETPGKVKHTLIFSMVDGKVCNSVTHTTSTMRCYICGATSKEFNDITLKKAIKTETLEFGLSILHARIRLFEHILHISYKIPVGKWQTRSKEETEIVAKRKLEIQNLFKTEMGLLVDIPKPGFGNTNDGNTSRRFFADPELAAKITGVNQNLIFRFKVILEAISCGKPINIEKFEAYNFETAETYVNLYPWYPMSPTIHKILLHGPEIIKNALLPIGQLSEEAAECRNKHFRTYRDNFARKCSREKCNEDVLNRLLLTSDPLLSSIRQKAKKISKPLQKETMEMLLADDDEEDDDEEDEDEEKGEEVQGETDSDVEVENSDD